MALTGFDMAPGRAGGTATPSFDKAYIAPGKDGKPYVKNPSKLWKETMDLRDDALAVRKQHERLWALCWMFYKGDQWRKPAPQPDWNIIRINVGKKPKITINKILPMVQTRRAHVLKNRPTGVVMPASTSEEDRNAARVAQDILDYDFEHLNNWEILDGKLSLCMFVTGNAFKKIYYDPLKGPKRERNKYRLDPDTGAPMLEPPAPLEPPLEVSAPPGEAGNTDMEPENEPESGRGPIVDGTYEQETGDIVIEFVPPEEVLPEPSATCMEDCERLLHRTLKPLKWVKDTYGDAAEDVKPINLKSDRGKSLAQGAKLFGLTEREVANRVEVLEAWYKPTEDYPEGLHAVWADDKMLAAGPTPEAHEYIPFVHYMEIETDEFWGISSVSQTIDPQKALNLAVSRDEYMRQRLRPKLMAATDSGLDEAAYSNDDAEIVFVNHPFYPKFTEPPAFERDEKAVGYFASAIDDIGGSADVMRGQISGGDVRSGRMVNYLQEYAGTVLAGPARSIERGEESTGNMILRLRKHYTDEPRLYYIVGRNKDVEVKQFIGSDIEGCADYIVQAGSALPMSMAEKRDLVLSMVEKGIVPPGDPRIIKMLGMPSDIDEMFNADQLDRDNATEENHKFLALGTPGGEENIAKAYGLIKQQQDMTAQMAGFPDAETMGRMSGPPPSPEAEIGMGQPGQPPGEVPGGESGGPAPAPGATTGGGPPPPEGAPGMAPQAGPPTGTAGPPMGQPIQPHPSEILGVFGIRPRDFENHVVHLETHNKVRKTRAYRNLPPAAQALFDEHCDLHAQFLLPPPPPPGAPPGPGGPGGGPKAEGRMRTKGKAPSLESKPGSPAALQGKTPPGTGGAAGPQGNQERAEKLPPSRKPPGANQHHLLGRQ